MRRYRLGSHATVHLVWCPKYRKRVLTGQVATRHLWTRGYFAVTSGTITDELINEYINEQEGEAVQDDSRFEIAPS
jgi:REP element-mobilizing transposase RayT